MIDKASRVKKSNKVLWLEYIFIFFSIFFISLGIYVIINNTDLGGAFDSVDRGNLVQIALFTGAVLAVWVAGNLQRETIKLQEYAIHLQEEEQLPRLIMFIRDVDKDEGDRRKNWGYRFFENGSSGKYFAIRNAGKGPAYNISVTKLGSKKVNDIEICGFSCKGLSIAPGGDEIPINVYQSQKNGEEPKEFRSSSVNDLNGIIFKVEVFTAISEDPLFYVFSIKDVRKGQVIRLKRTWDEGEASKLANV